MNLRFSEVLNSSQYEAVSVTDAPLLVFAGAGTGKTRVITYKIAWLIQKCGFPASSILGVTFTNKSALEMKERVRNLIGVKQSKGITLSTFHSLGVQILKKHIGLLGYNSKFSIYDDAEQLSVVGRILDEKGKDHQEFPPRLVQYVISRIKNTGSDSDAKAVFRDLYARYQQFLKNYNALDFDDLILKPVEILRNHKKVAAEYRKKFRYVLIDEYQDTNPAQYEFIRLLLNKENRICAVGDDDQSIYSWRGSDLGIILSFEHDFPSAKIVRLTENYRSTMSILEASNAVIGRNESRKPKKLWSARGQGEKLLFVVCENEDREARVVTDRIFRLRNELGLKFSDFAVLYRTNFQSRPIELACRVRNIPYKVVGGMNFFDRKEVKDLLAYLRLIANQKDEISLLRVINYPRRAIGDRTVSTARELAGKGKISLFESFSRYAGQISSRPDSCSAVSEFTELIMKYHDRMLTPHADLAAHARDLLVEIGYEDQLFSEKLDEDKVRRRMGNISELINFMTTFTREEPEAGLFDLLQRIALLSDTEKEKEEGGEDDRVTLLTVHSSKGLEFPNTFLIGMEKDLFPHLRSIEEREGDLEEERRLFYVALTRGKDRVTLTAARKRKLFGAEQEREISVFLSEIPPYLLDQREDQPVMLDEKGKQSAMHSLLEKLKSREVKNENAQ